MTFSLIEMLKSACSQRSCSADSAAYSAARSQNGRHDEAAAAIVRAPNVSARRWAVGQRARTVIEAGWRVLKVGAKVHLDLGAAVERHGRVVVPLLEVVKGDPLAARAPVQCSLMQAAGGPRGRT